MFLICYLYHKIANVLFAHASIFAFFFTKYELTPQCRLKSPMDEIRVKEI